MWNQDISGTSAPAADRRDRPGRSRCAADFAAVEAQFTLQDDPDGSIAQNLMTLVYGSHRQRLLLRPAEQHLHHSVPYSTPPGQPACPRRSSPRSAASSATTTCASSSDLRRRALRRGHPGPRIDTAADHRQRRPTPRARMTAAGRQPCASRREPAGGGARSSPPTRNCAAVHGLRRPRPTRCRTSGRRLLASFLPMLKAEAASRSRRWPRSPRPRAPTRASPARCCRIPRSCTPTPTPPRPRSPT